MLRELFKLRYNFVDVVYVAIAVTMVFAQHYAISALFMVVGIAISDIMENYFKENP